MNNDLISRSALKNDLKQYFTDGVLDGVSAKLAFNQILHDINNAPSVEVGYLTNCANCEKVEKLRAKRPQGEWKLHGLIYYCSECGHDYEQGGNNYCGNCGAVMKGANNG